MSDKQRKFKVRIGKGNCYIMAVNKLGATTTWAGESICKKDGGLFTVDYTSPAVGVTLFSSTIESEAQRVRNRLFNITWSVFQEILSGNPAEQARLYLDGADCLMRNR